MRLADGSDRRTAGSIRGIADPGVIDRQLEQGR
jgi:hypothetical protein